MAACSASLSHDAINLYKRRVGLGVIAAGVERPELALLFRDEGWLQLALFCHSTSSLMQHRAWFQTTSCTKPGNNDWSPRQKARLTGFVPLLKSKAV